MSTIRDKDRRGTRSSSKSSKSAAAPNKTEERLKICVVGAQCGKSALIHRFLEDDFILTDDPTVEDYFKSKVIVGPVERAVEILDTSGNDFYTTLHDKWWKWADAFVFVFAINQKWTLDIAKSYYQMIKKAKKKDCPMVLVGTQADMESHREVSVEQATQLATEYKCQYIEASAKTGANVQEIFQGVVMATQKSFVTLRPEWDDYRRSRQNTLRNQRASSNVPPPEESKPVDTQLPAKQEKSLDDKIKDAYDLKSEIEAQIINIAKKKLEAMEKGDFDGARKYKLETEKMQEERILIEAELTRLLDEQKTQEQANNNNTPTPTESQKSSRPPSRPPPKAPDAPVYAEQLKALRKQIYHEKASVKFFRSNGEHEEAKKLQESIASLEQQVNFIEKQYRFAKRREFDPSKHSKQEHDAACVIQRIARRYLARKIYASRLKMHKHRTNVVNEILATEVHYVNSIKQIVELYMKPLKANKLMSPEDIKIIFSDIEIILAANKNLLQDLDKNLSKWMPSQVIGSVFLQMGPVLRVYSMYVNNFERAHRTIAEYLKKDAYIAFLDSHGFTTDHLESLLIMPVQRIPRYVLLLEDLLKNTWTDHRDYSNIAAALNAIRETATIMNEKKREAENIRKVFEVEMLLSDGRESLNLIEAQRRFVKEGILYVVVNRKKKQERYIYLFNDILLVTKRKKSKEEKYEVRQKVPLKNVDIIDHEDTEHVKNGFELLSPTDSLWFSAQTLFIKEEWLKMLKAVLEILTQRQKFYEEQHTKVARTKATTAKALIVEKYASMSKASSREMLEPLGPDPKPRRSSETQVPARPSAAHVFATVRPVSAVVAPVTAPAQEEVLLRTNSATNLHNKKAVSTSLTLNGPPSRLPPANPPNQHQGTSAVPTPFKQSVIPTPHKQTAVPTSHKQSAVPTPHKQSDVPVPVRPPRLPPRNESPVIPPRAQQGTGSATATNSTDSTQTSTSLPPKTTPPPSPPVSTTSSSGAGTSTGTGASTPSDPPRLKTSTLPPKTTPAPSPPTKATKTTTAPKKTASSSAKKPDLASLLLSLNTDPQSNNK